MTQVQVERWEMPSAAVGGVNPLPPLFAGGNLDKTADLTGALGPVGDEIRAGAGYGRVESVCPYLLQDSYTRERSRHAHPAIVLANEHLRATFLPGLGGRLWSLRHVATGDELLFTNPVLQPAHLALRNAWFAGGVEWNIGTIGHTPLTCDPMHAALVRADDGSPALRLYEFERIRRVVYQIDVQLPPGSPVLIVHVRIGNPNRHEVPMYWWSNIAVPQAPGTRVLVPADFAWNYSYENVLRRELVCGPVGGSHESGDGSAGDRRGRSEGPGAGPSDVSYPARFADAADFFFDLADATQPFIAAVDASGTGVFQTSTRNLVGRKLFRWGTGPGGRRWQQWLTGMADDPAAGYAEIQAGLARTQFEHLRMPAGATWSWTEAYGRIDLATEAAHGPWRQARLAAESAIAAAMPADRLTVVHTDAGRLADRAPESLLHTGSGWGAFERRLRARAGEPPIDAPGTPFPDASLSDEQRPWLALLESGPFPDPEPGELPGSVHLHPLLADLLAGSTGWAAPAMLGVIRARDGDPEGARAAWQSSLERAENVYARRNLAVLAARAGRLDEAAEQYARALESGRVDRTRIVEPLLATGPGAAHPALVIEALRAFLAAGQAPRALEVIDGLPIDQRDRGRVRLLEATAALAAGDLDRCGEILSDPDLQVADLREGEDSLDQLWWEYRTRLAAAERHTEPDDALRAEIRRTVTVPAHLDFRMHP